MIASKKQLAVRLSRLQSFETPSLRLEQYPTDSEIAAEIIWFASQIGDIEGKVVADLGCGTGILGIAAMFFKPKKIYFVDIDRFALKKLQSNLELFELGVPYEIINSDIASFNTEVDLVLQNPPFGTKTEHADKQFLEKAFSISSNIYSFHKTTSDTFIKKISEDFGFSVNHFFRFDFPIKQTQSFHKRKIHRIDVGCWHLEKDF